MPELPDLTVYAANLSSRLNGKKVQSIDASLGKRLNVSPEELRNAISGATLDNAKREGKEILFKFSNNSSLLVHLMLAGGFAITQKPDTIKFNAITISFDDGTTLVVTDPRGLVTAKLNPQPSKVPDALDIDADFLRQKIAKKPKLLAKGFLVDQSIVRGIGNAYADEILWHARISPKSIMGKIPDAKIDTLFECMRSVLIDSVDEIKQAQPDIISGEVRDFMAVHNPRKKQSPTGRPIMVEQIASKKTYFTDEQVLYT
ncbi:MAG TPA: DNA-formamidopyrimidine glycosylase family protein [Blastocatellia bacterium]|nr:DNA-formamidopyrimidine glycosylase family protein [Blastocatellia bacterium]